MLEDEAELERVEIVGPAGLALKDWVLSVYRPAGTRIRNVFFSSETIPANIDSGWGAFIVDVQLPNSGAAVGLFTKDRHPVHYFEYKVSGIVAQEGPGLGHVPTLVPFEQTRQTARDRSIQLEGIILFVSRVLM